MKALSGACVTRADAHGVELAVDGGASFSVQVLEAALVRVRYRPATGYKEPRTWAIAPQAGHDVAWAGRSRDDLGGFSCPAAALTHDGAQVTLATEA